MNIIFTKHVKVRMLQREITQEEIKSLIKYPALRQETFKDRTAAQKKFSRGTLEVIYKKLENKILEYLGIKSNVVFKTEPKYSKFPDARYYHHY